MEEGGKKEGWNCGWYTRDGLMDGSGKGREGRMARNEA